MEDIRKINLAFHYSERLKSNFLIVGRMFILEKDKLESGKELLATALQGIRGEINIAKRHFNLGELELAELKVREAEGNLKISRYEEAKENLSEGLSHITTLSNRYIESLKEKDLI